MGKEDKMNYEKFRKIQKQILSCSSFDDIAPPAIYLYADLKYKNQTRTALNRLKKKCSQVSEVKSLKVSDVINGNDELGLDGLYNEKFEEILEDYNFKTEIDSYGAKCFRDAEGNRHCGDSSGFYPFYLDEKTLREYLEELR